LPSGYSDLVRPPEQGWGIVVLANANSNAALPRLDGIAAGVARGAAGKG
jgi:hypothetical protein